LTDVVDRIDTGNVLVNSDAIRDADQLFGWGILEIEDAFRKLQSKHFHKTEPSRVKPGVFLDVYKGKINGERIYTHFYFDEQDFLVINSFKRQ
jgi:hypothetical protein